MLPPNSRYSCHLDDEFQKSREARVSPWAYVKNNYIITKHFAERMNQRRISIQSISNILQFGKKYYIPEENSIMIKHVYENRGIIERDGVLVTTMFFGRDKKVQEMFTKSNEYFIFETE